MNPHEYIRLGEVGLVPRGLLADAPELRPLFVARVEIAERQARNAALRTAPAPAVSP